MRRLSVETPVEHAEAVIDLGHKHDSILMWTVDLHPGPYPSRLIVLHVANDKVGGVITELATFPKTKVSLIPADTIAFAPPYDQAQDEVIDVAPISPVEVFLSGLQSVGSWYGYLGYAVAATILAWIGLFTDASIVLIAAVLIAPFGGPAMNVALATARGDTFLLKQSLLRYVAGVLAMIGVGALLSVVLQQDAISPSMIDATTVSRVSFLLPLITGAVSAHALFQSEGANLVASSAVGALVAASITPPAAAVGMALATGNFAIVDNGLYLLALQLVAINIGGGIVFRLYGLKAVETLHERGAKRVWPVAMAVSGVLFIGLLAWQFAVPNSFTSSTLAQRIDSDIREVVSDSRLAELLGVQVELVREQSGETNTVYAVVYVHSQPGSTASAAEIEDILENEISRAAFNNHSGVRFTVAVYVLEPPPTDF